MFRTSSRSFRVSASAAVLVCVAASVAHSATVAGNVVDSTTSLPLAGVEVLVDGVPSGVTTDISGQFKAEVTEGERLFTFKRTGFSEQSIGPVTVAAEGETAVPPAKLAPDSANDIVMLDSLDVTGELVKGGSGDLQNTRLKADVAIDFLSADEFAKFGAGDVAESLIRVPGVSIVQGQFAVIRGLSDRYTPTTLSGLKIPSPDPEKQAPQLDVLPTSLVETLVVSKTFAPILWAESSGGTIDLTPKGFPEERKISVSVGLKANENAVNDGGPTYDVPDERNDLFASGFKSRPGELPKPSQGLPWTRPHDFSVSPGSGLPMGNKVSLGYGETFIWGDKRLGINVAGAWERSSKSQSGSRKRVYLSPNAGKPVSESDYSKGTSSEPGLSTYDFESSEIEVGMNAVGNLAFEFNKENLLKFTSFYTRSGSDFASFSSSPLVEFQTQDGTSYIVGEDVSDPVNGDPQSFQKFKNGQRYTERELLMNQFGGEHTLTGLSDLEIKWAAQIAETSQNEPGVTEVTFYEQLGENSLNTGEDFGIQPGFVGISSSKPDLFRSWSFTEEKQTAERVDLTLPTEIAGERSVKIKFGGAREDTDRSYRGKSDFYRANDANLTEFERTVPAGSDINSIFNRLLTNNNGDFVQVTQPKTTEQSRDLSAGYLGAELDITSKLKFAAGGRFERLTISTAGRDVIGPYSTGLLYHRILSGVFGTELIPALTTDEVATSSHVTRVNFAEDTLHPALGFVYKPQEKVNLRLNYSETTARPSMRELGPYFNRSLETGDYVLGNPALETSQVKNYDFRAEWLPSSVTMVAASVFAKTITAPIEKIYLPDVVAPDSLETWVNNSNEASMYGVELEARCGLDVISEALENFSVGGNVTYIDAAVAENSFSVASLSSQNLIEANSTIERRLYDQPEWLGNFDVTWNQRRWGTTATLAFNYTSDVLYAAGGGASGSSSSYDIYTRATHRVDLGITQKLTKNLKLRVGVKNITDPERGTIYDPERTSSELIRSKYHSGREYSLSLSADF